MWKELPAHRITRRKALWLGALGALSVPAWLISSTIGCEEEQPQKQEGLIVEGFDLTFADKLLALTNDERIGRGIPPVFDHGGLIKVAREYAKTLAQNNWPASHQGPDGTTLLDRITEAGFSPFVLRDENIGYGVTQDTPSNLFDRWMKSQNDRENILDHRFTLIGVGCYVSKDSRLWCVQDFVGTHE